MNNDMCFPVKILMLGCCLWAFSIFTPGRAQEETTEVEIRLANGVPVEGTFKSAAPEGLTVRSAKGTMILPWKYLSAGTRWRYERPMLAGLEAKRIKAEQEAKAKVAAAAKAAAAANKPKATGQGAGVTTNKPAAK